MIVFSLEWEKMLSFVTTWVDLKSIMPKEITKIREIKVNIYSHSHEECKMIEVIKLESRILLCEKWVRRMEPL